MIRKSIRSIGEDSSGDASAEYHVLGGGHAGASLAHYLWHQGRSVVLVDESGGSSEDPSHRGDPSDRETHAVFESAGREHICASTDLADTLDEAL
ncbi:hypothetical protein G9C85_16630 [Halorubellus sp. JP-L1]|uniref:FAD-dependent monooxygenase n=1 Tax=Halorubellus sp. JP-L1 TaxID=2715753 RepID=UPI001408B972|nr:FAD-dependent monooxygenase [Halorubellus sp. JP-L1]NHN43244.1 hypothetical protein [Halorubellus sp. JP-L1]